MMLPNEVSSFLGSLITSLQVNF